MIRIKSALVKCGYYYNCCHVTGVNQTGVTIKLADRFTRTTAPAFSVAIFIEAAYFFESSILGALHYRFAILLF